MTGGVGPGTFEIGPLKLLAGAWLDPLAGFMPVLRIRLPLPSLAFDTPYCASAEVPHASMQKIANANLMCPRLYSGPYHRSACPDMHAQTAVLEAVSLD